MERECCNIKVTELDDGYRIEITGKDFKEKCNCWEVFKNCCGPQQKTADKEK